MDSVREILMKLNMLLIENEDEDGIEIEIYV
jgi:hypothetical protein